MSFNHTFPLLYTHLDPCMSVFSDLISVLVVYLFNVVLAGHKKTYLSSVLLPKVCLLDSNAFSWVETFHFVMWSNISISEMTLVETVKRYGDIPHLSPF